MEAIYERQSMRADFPFQAAVESGSGQLYHWHDEIELVLVQEGTLDAVIPGRSYHLQPGEILIIGSGEVHCLTSDDPASKRVSVRFSPRLAAGKLSDGSELSGLNECFTRVSRCSAQWGEAETEEVRKLILQMMQEDVDRRKGWQAAVRAEIYQLMVMMMRRLPDRGEDAARKAVQDVSLKKTLSFLAENYTQDISLKECADAMGFNMNYFSRFFRSHTGIHFHQYLTTLRLQKAERLLLTTGLPITEIVFQSGFQNVKTFNRVFKNAHGCSPREFRRGVPSESGQKLTDGE